MSHLHSLAACAGLLAACAAGAQSASPPERFWASAAVVNRQLSEEGASGARLLTETGPMLELRLGARQPLASGGVLAGELMGAGGSLDYDGQTQGGAPFQTRSRHRDVGTRLMWRPTPAQAWGEPWLLLGWQRNQRSIAGMSAVSGLREISSATLAGVRWQSPAQQVTAQWQVRMEAEATISLRHRLEVDFEGLFDDTHLRGGRQRRTALRLVGTAPHTPWEWTLEWAHLDQAPSAAVPLLRTGALAGTVRQPHLTVEDFGARLTRRF